MSNAQPKPTSELNLSTKLNIKKYKYTLLKLCPRAHSFPVRPVHFEVSAIRLYLIIGSHSSQVGLLFSLTQNHGATTTQPSMAHLLIGTPSTTAQTLARRIRSRDVSIKCHFKYINK